MATRLRLSEHFGVQMVHVVSLDALILLDAPCKAALSQVPGQVCGGAVALCSTMADQLWSGSTTSAICEVLPAYTLPRHRAGPDMSISGPSTAVPEPGARSPGLYQSASCVMLKASAGWPSRVGQKVERLERRGSPQRPSDELLGRRGATPRPPVPDRSSSVMRVWLFEVRFFLNILVPFQPLGVK